MYLPLDASKARVREAENARNNRLEIVKALSQGQISRRDLFKWGLFTTGGMIAAEHGPNRFYAPSAYGQVPTGAPRSPLGTAIKFNIPMSRPAACRRPTPSLTTGTAMRGGRGRGTRICLSSWPGSVAQRVQRQSGRIRTTSTPSPARGRFEGRPPGEFFAHQHWMASRPDSDLFPKVSYLMWIRPMQAGSHFHPGLAEQNANSVWSFGTRLPGHVDPRTGSRLLGYCTPCLFKLRYGEPVVFRC